MLSAKVEGAVSLAWGLPSFRTPEHIRAAVAEALQNDPDIGKYSLPNGVPELRQRVAEHHRAQTGVKVDAIGLAHTLLSPASGPIRVSGAFFLRGAAHFPILFKDS